MKRVEVERVIDGDTVRVHFPGTVNSVSVRLSGIDAPELSQAFGRDAKAALAGLIDDNVTKLHVIGRDKYGRTLGSLYVYNKASGVWVDVQKFAVASGWAWVYKRYTKDANFLKLQTEAQRHQRGLWKALTPVPPWEYRANKKK